MAIIAHEMGHYKKHHILKMVGLSFWVSGLMFFLLSFFMENEGLFRAFKMEQISIYASLVFFSFLFAPINAVFGILTNGLSRRHEFEADAYAVRTSGHPDALVEGLKRLSVENLSNLTPHPMKVWLDYSHPPVLKRIAAMRAISNSSS